MCNSDSLTEREKQVLSLTANGLTAQEIGDRLEISPRTVEVHIANIFLKLGVNKRTQAVAKALKRGMITFEEVELWRESHRENGKPWTA